MEISPRTNDYSKAVPGGAIAAGSMTRIETLGFGQRTQNALTLLLGTRREGRYLLVDGGQADVTIVDLDGLNGRELWKRHRQHAPERPAILLSINDQKMDGAHFLRKPIHSSALLSLLDRLTRDVATRATSAGSMRVEENRPADAPLTANPEDGLRSRRNAADKQASKGLTHSSAMQLGEKSALSFVGTAQDIDPADPRQVAKAQFDPDRYLLGNIAHALSSAAAKKRPLRLKSKSLQGTICLSREESEVRLETATHHVRTLAALPMDNSDIRMELLAADSFSGNRCDSSYAMEEFLWELALWTSRGRVPIGTDLNAKVGLTRWPNMSRL